MPWYSAHLVLYVVFKDGMQDSYPVREDVVLIEADSVPEAFEKAKASGHDRERDEGEDPRRPGRKGTWAFVGVRKLVECDRYDDRPGDGTDITYSVFEVEDRAALQRLAKGEEVGVTYRE